MHLLTRLLFPLLCMAVSFNLMAQTSLLLLPQHTFDGERLLSGQSAAVLIEGDRITATGSDALQQAEAIVELERIELPGMTLMPGLIDLHSHVLLHPYDETPWNDQVLKESDAERVVRATNHLRDTLRAGFTTLRDLGSEGAGYADIGVRQALEKGVIPGPRLLVSGPAIVATGSYGPKGFKAGVEVPLGANVADGHDSLLQEVRRQIGGGVDWIKVYADYRWGPNGEARPTFSLSELQLIVDTAASSGRPVVAHASTAEGMQRAVQAGVKTIEHGDNGTAEVFAMMADEGVAFCPTLGAVEAISRYNGWQKGIDPEPSRITLKKHSLQLAMQAGVTICNGSDVGVFSHGDNAYELELLVEYGLSTIAALQSATQINAAIIGMADQIGSIKPDALADIVVVEGNPTETIAATRNVRLVLQNGKRAALP